MKKFVFVFFTFFGYVIVSRNSASARPESKTDKYSSIYDNVDWDAIVNSPRLLRMYINCLMDKGPCNPEGKQFKKNIPDAMQNGCAKCTAAQKKGTGKIVKYLTEHKRDWYEEVISKYDPDRSAEKKYLKQVLAYADS